ncbi:MAG: GspE/PulE family protein [bacterium]|nr:GspE/PulE family protein [bacterium]
MAKIVQFFVQKGVLDKTKATEIEFKLRNSSKTEEEILFEEKTITEKEIFDAKSDILGIEYLKEIPEEAKSELLKLIPEDVSKFYKMIPIFEGKGVVEIGMVYPEDLGSQEALKFLAREKKINYKVILIDFSTFDKIFKNYRELDEEMGRALQELEVQLKSPQADLKDIEMEVISEEAPTTKMVAVILRQAVEGKASDIHIEPMRNNLRVRYRLDGILHSSLVLPLKAHPAIVARIKILSNLKIDESRVPQDGRFSIKLDKITIDFRVSTFPTSLGEKVVIRILDPREAVKSFSDLGIESLNLEMIERASNKPYGMILVTGPTGSGKTTTLYSILRNLNKETVNVITLEDPVEYFIDGVNQSQVRPEINYTFATGLRSIVRQDPDIIMVGEIRDSETASLAIHASLTGHLVLSTLHTNDAIGSIPRLIDMGIEPFLLPSSLDVVIAQRLVRKICPFCKEKIMAPEPIKKILTDEYKNLPEIWKKNISLQKEIYTYKGKGCKKCNNEGFSGRIGIFEILEITPEISGLIFKNSSENIILEQAKKQGMISMRQDGFIKVIQGITTLEEVLRATKL